MKKHIIFGGFDYAVRWEMDQDAIYRGIDYFVDNDPNLIGTTYLGKPVYGPEKLLEEDPDNIMILIGSIIYHTEIEFQLKDMGFEEGIHYQWGIGFCGDERCSRLWKHIEWNDRTQNNNLSTVEQGEYTLSRLRVVSRLIDFTKYDTIVDIGAANERIRAFLPGNIRYLPVDYIRYSEETILYDLRKNEFPRLESDSKRTCIILIAIIMYAPDWKWLLRRIGENCDTFICSHHDFVRLSREYRRTQFNNNNVVFNHQIILEMQHMGFQMTQAYDFRVRDTIMKFERSCSR